MSSSVHNGVDYAAQVCQLYVRQQVLYASFNLFVFMLAIKNVGLMQIFSKTFIFVKYQEARLK